MRTQTHNTFTRNFPAVVRNTQTVQTQSKTTNLKALLTTSNYFPLRFSKKPSAVLFATRITISSTTFLLVYTVQFDKRGTPIWIIKVKVKVALVEAMKAHGISTDIALLL